MVTATRLLLRLPPGLRQHIFLDPARCALRLNATSIRTYVQQRKPLPPPPRPFDNLQAPPEPHVLKGNNKANGIKPSPHTQEAHPDKNVILLYTAPSHGIFYITSYLAGGFFVLGAYVYSELVLKDPPDGSRQPWWKKSIGAVSALAAASFGTWFILGPMGMIKSISIVTSEATFANATTKFTRAPRSLRIEVKRKLPFLKPDVLETDLANVTLDRRVPVAIQDLYFHTIPKSSSEAWTAAYFAGTAKPTRHGGVAAAVKGLWPATIREVRRMFLRDQIAYLQVKGNGTFKLDLQGCMMLEGGQTLDRVIAEDLTMARGLPAWLQKLNSRLGG